MARRGMCAQQGTSVGAAGNVHAVGGGVCAAGNESQTQKCRGSRFLHMS